VDGSRKYSVEVQKLYQNMPLYTEASISASLNLAAKALFLIEDKILDSLEGPNGESCRFGSQMNHIRNL
jgi:hypothetical protein